MNNKKNFKIHILIFISIVIVVLFFQPWHKSNDGRKKTINYSAKLNNINVPFIINTGQLHDKDIVYYTKTFTGTIFIRQNGEVSYFLPGKKRKYSDDGSFESNKISKGNSILLSEIFIGNRIKEIKGEKKSSTEVNLFLGNNPELWQTDIPTFEFVDFGEIYEGICFKLKAYSNTIEKIFIVYPDADPDQIRIKVKGANFLEVNRDGELIVNTGKGDILFTTPVAYQIDNGEKTGIKIAYAVNDDEYGFSVGNYNIEDTLIIDPLLASTFLGGNGLDEVHSIGADSEGNIYIAGYSTSSDFPTNYRSYDRSYNDIFGSDVIISKLDSSLTKLLASTYIGGSGTDFCRSLEVTKDNIFVSGRTASVNFPIHKYYAFDTVPPNDGLSKVYIVKMEKDLRHLVNSTFLGGTDFERANSMTLDSTGNVFICGETNSQDFPVTGNSFCDSFHVIPYEYVSDGFISKLDNNLTTLIASTFIGGEDDDMPFAISISDNNEVYVAGFTSSPDFPITENAFDDTLNSVRDRWRDGFICKFDSNLSDLKASTFLGGDRHDRIYTIELDHSGNIIVAGETYSYNFPTTPGSFDQNYNGGEWDAFLSIFNEKLTTLKSSTYVGGNGEESIIDIAFNNAKDFYVVGSTGSTNFPTTEGAFDEGDGTYGGAYISKFDTGLINLYTSTLLGGIKGGDGIRGIVINKNSIYVAGVSFASDFPTTPGAFRRTFIGGSNPYFLVCGDLFLSKFELNLSSGINFITKTNSADDFQLEIYPNPFSTATRIKYRITAKSKINLSVYDINGRKVKTLLNKTQQPGYYSIVWDGRDNNNNLIRKGLYFITIQTKKGTYTKRIILSG